MRGYKPFDELRLVVVPWYDGIPQIGAVLFAAGWISGPRPVRMPRQISPLTRMKGLVVFSLLTGLVLLNGRDSMLSGGCDRETCRSLLPSERLRYPVPALKTLRTTAIVLERAAWQRRHLAKLEQAETVARRLAHWPRRDFTRLRTGSGARAAGCVRRRRLARCFPPRGGKRHGNHPPGHRPTSGG